VPHGRRLRRTPPTRLATPAAPVVPVGRLGKVVHGPGLDVTVRTMRCGKKQLTDRSEILVWTPGGPHCLLNVVVKNVSPGRS
jgi:hypothetical protein